MCSSLMVSFSIFMGTKVCTVTCLNFLSFLPITRSRSELLFLDNSNNHRHSVVVISNVPFSTILHQKCSLDFISYIILWYLPLFGKNVLKMQHNALIGDQKWNLKKLKKGKS